jgi:two-component system LytT family response regulator
MRRPERRPTVRTKEAVRMLAADVGAQKRIMVKRGKKICLLRIAEIDWVEAAEDYVFVHVRDAKFTLRSRMSSFEHLLPTDSFARIHRSFIVNLDRILELEPLNHGEFALTLEDKTTLTLSRKYRRGFFERMTVV